MHTLPPQRHFGGVFNPHTTCTALSCRAGVELLLVGEECTFAFRTAVEGLLIRKLSCVQPCCYNGRFVGARTTSFQVDVAVRKTLLLPHGSFGVRLGVTLT